MIEDKKSNQHGCDIFVLSDLHIGDGSEKDILLKWNTEKNLYRLLDQIDKSESRLVILGDLFELWRYKPQAVVERWSRLLDRLEQMDVIYVPGNHDWQFWQERDYWQRQHPFFKSMRKPFIETIGDKRFKFMHGHEIDPMISESMGRWRPVLRALSSVLELHPQTCMVTCDPFTDALLEAGERCLHIWQRLTKQFNQTVHEHLGFADDGIRYLIRPMRTRNMIARFYGYQQQDEYDITITGHTHQAGRFRDWYFNCGCWTRSVVNYLRILPDGAVIINDRSAEGEKVNSTVVLD